MRNRAFTVAAFLGWAERLSPNVSQLRAETLLGAGFGSWRSAVPSGLTEASYNEEFLFGRSLRNRIDSAPLTMTANEELSLCFT